MTRNIIAVIVAVAVFWAQTDALWAQRSRQSESSRSRGSVSASSRASASSRGSVSRSGNTWSGESRSGNVQGSGSRTKTDEGFQVDRTFTTDSGASKTVSKDVNVEDREVQRDATTTNTLFQPSPAATSTLSTTWQRRYSTASRGLCVNSC